MRQRQDIATSFPGILIIHQKIRAAVVEPHRHDGEHEVFLPLQGEIRVKAGERVLKAGPGKMIFEALESRFDQPLSMAALAKGAGLSVRNLNRLFMEELGMTPKRLVTFHRIEKAKRLLRRERLAVTDVAYEVGYSSVSQFITTFRSVTGRLPSESR